MVLFEVTLVSVDQIRNFDWLRRTRLPSLESLSSEDEESRTGVSLLATQTGVSLETVLVLYQIPM